MLEVDIEKMRKLNYRTNEAYKTLRTNIQLCGSDMKVIMFTSSTPNEGKSSVSFNLAVSLAESGKRVIFVDADLRKSVLVGRYKINKKIRGLSHYLSGMCNFSEAVCATNVDNFHVIFSGVVPPNPSELLGNKTYEALIMMLRGEYDYVIIDTPPLGSVIDAAVAAKSCDGTVLVVENNAVSYRFVQSVKEQLDKAGSRILGVVLNKVDMDGRGYYGHYGRYYGKYYGKYYGRYGDGENETAAEK